MIVELSVQMQTETNELPHFPAGSFDTKRKNTSKPIDLQGFERISSVVPKLTIVPMPLTADVMQVSMNKAPTVKKMSLHFEPYAPVSSYIPELNV